MHNLEIPMSLDRYFTLGNSGLRVGRLALGTMTFGTDWGWGADKSTARSMLDRYLARGGNLIDTADLYTNGDAERWIGEFLHDRGDRDRVVVSTKFSFNGTPDDPNAGGNGRKHILRALEGSLARLRTDYVDLYLLHAWDLVTPVDEVMRTLDDLVRAGKVRHVGFSNVPAWYAGRAQAIAQLRGYEPPTALQLEYSLAERAIEHEFIPFGVRHGAGVMAWSPLASGLLSGKYRAGDLAAGARGSGRLATLADSGNPAFAKFTERNFGIVAELERVAAACGRSMSQVAINWVAGRPGVATVLVGATREAQLDDNLQALDFELPPELRARLDAVGSVAPPYPYTFFEPALLAMLAGAKPLGDKPAGYTAPIRIEAAVPAAVKADNAASGSR
jgi:aryl-alcohol dehydrogenase-like predicted oxidoreductase